MREDEEDDDEDPFADLSDDDIFKSCYDSDEDN